MSQRPDYFHYEPLESSTKCIRLLRFAPEQRRDSNRMPEFETEVVFLEEEFIPRYYATSYFWGDSNAETCVKVNGQQLCIPQNAEKTLKALDAYHSFVQTQLTWPGLKRDPARVWIDAVCIDQRNSRERSDQVALMHKIYAQAEEVFIWLGDANDKAAEAAVHEVHASFENCMSRFDGQSLSTSLSGAYLKACAWKYLSPLYESPWWRRVWTVQEGLLAKKATCVLGNRALPLYELILTAYAVSQREYSRASGMELQLVECMELAAARVKLKSLITSTRRRSVLLEFLKLLMGLDASDPRDMVYSLVGLLKELPANDSTYQYINVDYLSSVSEVFARTTVQCIRDSQTLEALQLAAVQSRDLGHQLPSWALDLSKPSGIARDTKLDCPLEPNRVRLEAEPLRPQISTDEYGRYPRQHFQIQKHQNWTTLEVSGYTLDHVDSVISLKGVLPLENEPNLVSKLHEIRARIADSVVPELRSASNQVTADDTCNKKGSMPSGEHYSSTDAQTQASRSISTTDFSKNASSQQRIDRTDIVRDIRSYESLILPRGVAQAAARTLVAGIHTATKRCQEEMAYIAEEMIRSGVYRTYIRGLKPLRRALLNTKTMKRAFFITRQGRFGLALPNVKPGDPVCLLHGGLVPFVLRRQEDRMHWMLVSDAYVDGAEQWITTDESGAGFWELDQPSETFLIR